jgi:hypothetical protein
MDKWLCIKQNEEQHGTKQARHLAMDSKLLIGEMIHKPNWKWKVSLDGTRKRSVACRLTHSHTQVK